MLPGSPSRGPRDGPFPAPICHRAAPGPPPQAGRGLERLLRPPGLHTAHFPGRTDCGGAAGGAGGSVRGLMVFVRVLWAVGSSICRPWPRRTARARPTLELLLHGGCRSNRSSGVRGPGEGRAPVGRSTESGGARGCLAGLRLDVGQLGRALDRREEVAQQGSLLLLLLLRGSRSRTVGPVVGLDGGGQALGQLGLGPGGGDAVRVCGRGPSGP